MAAQERGMSEAMHPVGEPWWFDIPALQWSLQSILMMEPEEFGQWRDGEHAAELVNRISRILESVEARQRTRTTATPITHHPRPPARGRIGPADADG